MRSSRSSGKRAASDTCAWEDEFGRAIAEEQCAHQVGGTAKQEIRCHCNNGAERAQEVKSVLRRLSGLRSMKGQPAGQVLRGVGDQRKKQDQSGREKEEPFELVGGGVWRLLFSAGLGYFLQACHEVGGQGGTGKSE
jgi:hypothetical protein